MSITACETLNAIFLMSLEALREAWCGRLPSYFNMPMKDSAVQAWGALAERGEARNQPLPSESTV